MHGNGVDEPDRIAQMVKDVPNVRGYRRIPIVFNEDDYFDFERNRARMTAAVGEYASWDTSIAAWLSKNSTRAIRPYPSTGASARCGSAGSSHWSKKLLEAEGETTEGAS
jgi:hypothetical protein